MPLEPPSVVHIQLYISHTQQNIICEKLRWKMSYMFMEDFSNCISYFYHIKEELCSKILTPSWIWYTVSLNLSTVKVTISRQNYKCWCNNSPASTCSNTFPRISLQSQAKLLTPLSFLPMKEFSMKLDAFLWFIFYLKFINFYLSYFIAPFSFGGISNLVCFYLRDLICQWYNDEDLWHGIMWLLTWWCQKHYFIYHLLRVNLVRGLQFVKKFMFTCVTCARCGWDKK